MHKKQERGRIPSNDNKSISEVVSFSSDSLEVRSSLKLKCGIERYALEYIQKKKAIVIGDVIGNLYVWNSLNFKRVFQINAFDHGINNIRYNTIADSLIVASVGFKVFTLMSDGRLIQRKFLKSLRTFSLCIVPSLKVLLSSDIRGEIRIWNMSNYESKLKLETDGKKMKGYGMIYIEKYDALICAFECGKIVMYSVKEQFKEVSKVSGAKEGFPVTLGYNEKLNLVLAGTDAFVVKLFRIVNGNSLLYWIQYPITFAEIYEFVPAIIDKEESVLVTGRSCQVVILGLEQYRQDMVLTRKYSSVKLLKDQKKLLLGSNISNKIDIATFK